MSSKLSRQWTHHFWIHEHTDVHLTVLHLPSGSIKIRGRFSNGLKTAERVITTLTFIENEEGQIFHGKLIERVPPTGFGSTNVRHKEMDIEFSGRVAAVRAVASITNTGESFKVKVKGKGSESSGVDWEFVFKDKPDKIIKSAHPLSEGDPIDICAGFQPDSWVNYAAQTGHWTSCDSSTGKITEHSKALVKPIYPPGGIIP